MKFGVIIFPGSNCDQDIIHVLRNVLGQDVEELWHKDHSLKGLSKKDCIMVPGGFSFGDYLRPGAIAKFSPVMEEVIQHANNGGFVWGICNGFQILCETGLLPGALLRNDHQKFICQNQYLKVVSKNTPLTEGLSDTPISIPIAHADGRYFADEQTLQSIYQHNQVLFKYCNESGEILSSSNPNGSIDNIAGICNKNKNVFGMMPHPERAAEAILGNTDGIKLFERLLNLVS